MSGQERPCSLLDLWHEPVSNGTQSRWRAGRFRLTKEEVEAELGHGQFTEDELLCALTPPARLLARAPVSDFQVGCAAGGLWQSAGSVTRSCDDTVLERVAGRWRGERAGACLWG